MAEPSTKPLMTGEDDEEALSLLRRDLEASDRFKREYCPHDKISNRRKCIEGDPEAYGFPYDTSWGHRPVNNWMRVQVNHKVGKITRSPTRLNLKDAEGKDDEAMRLMLIALRYRLEKKAREAKWDYGRRKMALDAATVAFGVRAIGIAYERDRYVMRNFRVRAEEFHMDPMAEHFDDAEWMAWRRYVAGSKLEQTKARHPELRPSGAGGSLVPDGRPAEIALADDRILAEGRGIGSKGSAFAGIDVHLVTDYYRKDNTQDWYYPCSGCGEMVGRSTVVESGVKAPIYRCPLCGNEEKNRPDPAVHRRKARYPNGRHIRLIGPSTIDYRGENKLKLEDVFPFVGMSWYDAETWIGYSETQQLQSAQVLDNVAQAMLADNAFANAHSKVVMPPKGIVSGWNNNADDPIEVSAEVFQGGGLKRLETGDVSPAVRLMLAEGKQNLFLLAGNSPEAQGQAPDTLRSGVGLARVIAASEVGLLMTVAELNRADARFYRIARDICAMIDTPARVPMVSPEGLPGTFDYDRSLMTPNVEVEVITDRDVDQEREELFSRAVEMKGMGVLAVDDDMLLDLSGIPADIVQRGKERARMAQAMAQAQGLPPQIGGAGGAPAKPGGGLSVVPGGGGAGPGVPPAIAGKRAPKQTRPPSRSRGAETPQSGFGGR